MRADYRLRALFTFYVYDEGQKGFTRNHTARFIEAQWVAGHFGPQDINRIVTLCNKCTETGGKKTRSDKRVKLLKNGNNWWIEPVPQTKTILKLLVENKILENEEDVSPAREDWSFIIAIRGNDCSLNSQNIQNILPTMWASALKLAPELDMPIKVRCAVNALKQWRQPALNFST